jgi:hypothetical protein
MSILDPKEEVLKFELTRLGKERFANGNFKPVAYSFGDSGVVYDLATASGSEGQKDSGNRIYNETPTVAGNWINHQSAENSFSKEDARNKERAYVQRLGSMNSRANLAPKWRMNFLKGKMDAVTRIDPNWLEATGTIRYEIEESRTPTIAEDDFSYIVADQDKFVDLGDGFFAAIKDDYIIIELEEENVEFTRDNFTVRVRDVDAQKYLHFSREEDKIVPDDHSVENSVFLFLDKEIPEEIMCQHLSADKKKDFFKDTLFDCADNEVVDSIDWRAVYERQLKKFKGVC